ncbi:E3 ubiquitin/ISG15 ligase TRIM25-like [Nerophis lumbriciformis]|uniref:E3 ubiquitin/ISG15 ligase TRIM25-like n=1 Tax=Nerophis lumbriciformis TaxID=546530 RepID=UPI002AE04639|nr:E3 ubiquitin/ISG15 ligase TRIM25-like [Nerophis lumbriciformis]XP_061784556.1 E3 ubiquitin/ISG15 ligase TRIM25-like [Nerophis lumbriciformis]XP_061784557.1 E3 ubiquitin/ISG15 ligase TRIM25-like [Nerophis lumbriciformis]XP_061784558.1 E3 ubiquitin/ISG15 ligase TRIM25-like [Nerophis lumbriciformis]
MAHGGMVLDKDQFNCGVCLDVLKEPVTIPCGHSYCSDCISSYWDDDSNVKCPQCRQTFNPRPVLVRSILLDDMVGRFKQAVAGRTLAEEDDVECDLCPERKYKADKSCVQCLASFCGLHIQPHYQSNEFKTHTLITASKRVQECVCGQHNSLLEFYCRTDKQCICPLCVIDQHKGHDVVMAEVERQEQQNQLGKMKHDCQENIQQAQKRIEKVKASLSSVKDYDWQMTKMSEELKNIMISSLELFEMIHKAKPLVVRRVEQSLEKTDIVIKEQQMMCVQFDKLAETVNHVDFLKKLPSLKASSTSSPLPDFNLILFDDIHVYKEWMLEYYKKGLNDIYEKAQDFVSRFPLAPSAQAEAAPPARVTPPVQGEAAGEDLLPEPEVTQSTPPESS